MFSLRDVILFLAGAEFFHTLSHIFLVLTVPLPLDFKIVMLTPNLNMWSIVFNGVLTLLLLWWAVHLSKKK